MIDEKNTIDKAPVKPAPFAPDSYSVQTYLADTNQMLLEINQNIKYILQLLINFQEEKQQPLSEKERLVRTIGER